MVCRFSLEKVLGIPRDDFNAENPLITITGPLKICFVQLIYFFSLLLLLNAYDKCRRNKKLATNNMNDHNQWQNRDEAKAEI